MSDSMIPQELIWEIRSVSQSLRNIDTKLSSIDQRLSSLDRKTKVR